MVALCAACAAGPATDADIQRMKDDFAAEAGDIDSLKSQWRQAARSRGQSWTRIEAEAKRIDFDAYTQCFSALVNTAIDEVVEANPGATSRAIEEATIEVWYSYTYQAKLEDCVEDSRK